MVGEYYLFKSTIYLSNQSLIPKNYFDMVRLINNLICYAVCDDSARVVFRVRNNLFKIYFI